MDDAMQPLNQILQTLREQGITTVHRPHLVAKTLVNGEGAAQSFLDRLAERGLAESRLHGKRRQWYVSPAALPDLVELARGARPGPAPGTQITLDAVQLRAFVQHLALAVDPVEALRDALAAVTGWDDEAIAQAERVVIPLAPRRPLESRRRSSGVENEK